MHGRLRHRARHFEMEARSGAKIRDMADDPECELPKLVEKDGARSGLSAQLLRRGVSES